MNSTSHQPTAHPGRSWRTIRQEVSAPAMSRKGRRRQLVGWLKFGLLAILLTGTGWGILELVQGWKNNRTALATAVHSAPVREVVLITNGVLSQKWVTEVLDLPKSISLMALNLPGLRDRLLAHGQVQRAVLTRSFPDTLVVSLQERSPVVRVQASEGSGTIRQLFVAKDGVVFAGLGFGAGLVDSLPWLGGIRLVKTAGGFAPIPGMTDVSALLSTAQMQVPHLYRGWRVVSLARLDSADEIVVKSQEVAEIVFSRKRDFFKQVAQLDYVIDASHVLADPKLQMINLTLDGQVPVRLQGASDDLVTAAHPEYSIQPIQRKVKRDF